MGRDLVEMTRGWCFRETVSEAYGRTSRFFHTKEEALACLLENGYPEQLVDMLRESEHVPSMLMSNRGMYPCGIELDRAIRRAGMQRGGRHGQMMDMISDMAESGIGVSIQRQEDDP